MASTSKPTGLTTRGACYCCVINCSNNNHTSIDPRTGKTVRFFYFPNMETDRERCQKWIINIRRDDINIADIKWKRVCSAHFHEKAFNCPTDIQHSRLLPTAVPTIVSCPNPPSMECRRRPPKIRERVAKRRQDTDDSPASSSVYHEDHPLHQGFSQPGVRGSMEHPGVVVKTEPVEADSDQDLQEETTQDDTPPTFQIKLEQDVEEETTTPHCDVPRTMMSGETVRDGRETETPPHNGWMMMTNQTQDGDDGDDSRTTFEIKLEKDIPEEKEEDMSHTWKMKDQTEKESNQAQNGILSQMAWSAVMRSPSAVANSPSDVCPQRPVKRRRSVKRYPCTECEATFTESGSLKRHVRIHSGEKPYACTECEAAFRQSGDLTKHLRIHKGERPYSCSECEATFTESGTLKAHKRRHRGDKPYCCTVCGAKFTESGTLKRHMRTHNGDRPYSCSECEATFTESGSLRVHMRRHKGDKPYSCTECEAAFTMSGDLKRHMLRHKGDKLYSCTDCEAAFTVSSDLRRHMRKHKGDKPYTCTECEASFRRSDNLKKHMRRHAIPGKPC